MTKIIKEQLQDKINNLFEIYQGLEKVQRFSLDDLKNNIENVWAATFGLVAGIEAILDIGQYILADKGIKVESYGKIPAKLFEAKVINREFSEKIQKMIGFRNRAIHNYPSLDEKQLYEILHNNTEDFKEFLEIVNKYVKEL